MSIFSRTLFFSRALPSIPYRAFSVTLGRAEDGVVTVLAQPSHYPRDTVHVNAALCDPSTRLSNYPLITTSSMKRVIPGEGNSLGKDCEFTLIACELREPGP